MLAKLFAYGDDNKENGKGDANLNISQLSPIFLSTWPICNIQV
jgi:hypothetical protein